MSKVLISILTALILVVSCKQKCHYPYLDGLKNYLHEIHQYDLPDKGEIIFIFPRWMDVITVCGTTCWCYPEAPTNG